MRKVSRAIRFSASLFFYSLAAFAQSKPRARDLGVPFDGYPGPFNAISDVKGVEVGETTLISGEGPWNVGIGPVRTGVTAILPHGKNSRDAVFAGHCSLNGNGEMTGFLDGPILITNTHSAGIVRDAVRLATRPVAESAQEVQSPGTSSGKVTVTSRPGGHTAQNQSHNFWCMR